MRKMFERILIATDGSEKNQPAVRKSVEIARECGSTLYAIYVIDNTSVTSAQPEVLMGDVYMKLKAEGEKAVERIKEMAKGVNLEALVLSGRPANIVTGFAAKNRVDLIVVGSQGKSGLERLILGSVTESIIRMADCMVLVVKSE